MRDAVAARVKGYREVVGVKKLASRLFGEWVLEVGPASLRADALAGLLGALLVLPQGVAFATLAGLPPEYGLYSAIVPCIVAALFGSSRHVMSGPTNANSLALYAVLAPLAIAGSPQYIQMALVVTIMVGLLQWLVGALRLGTLANFISPSALFGFTSGAALLIAVHALNNAVGLRLETHSTSGIVLGVVSGWAHWQAGAVLVAIVTVCVAVWARRWDARKPHMLIGLIAGTSVAAMLNAWVYRGAAEGIQTLGALPAPIPPFHVPRIEWGTLPDLLGLAFALSIVAMAQSISIAKVVAARSGQMIDANREFRGQGLSNIVGGFFSSYLSCGSLNRSIPNYEAGARTPLASVFSAVLLLVLIVVSAPLLAKIPYAAIAGLLLLVAWNLFALPQWRRLARVQRQEFYIALATMVATVTIRMEVAILLGTLLSLMAYLYRTSHPAMRVMGFRASDPNRHFVVLEGHPDELPECPQLKLLRMEGSVYFGAVAYVADRLQALRAEPDAPKHLLVMAKSMNFIDHAGAMAWEVELRKRREMGGDLYFHRPRPAVLDMWRRTGFIDELGEDHIFPDKATAIRKIYERLDPRICANCAARTFRECSRHAAMPVLLTPALAKAASNTGA